MPHLRPGALPPLAAGWWGEKRFVSAGSLEGAKKDVQGAKERMTFNEDDQVWQLAVAQLRSPGLLAH